MPTSFDWEFEEESGPPGQGDRSGSLPRRSQRLRPGIVLLLLLALVAVATLFLARERQRVLRESEAQLRAAVELELKTIVDGDVELFRSRQDPTDAPWPLRQVARYFSANADQLVPAPGLVLADAPTEIRQIDIDGRTARVELVHWFADSNDSSDGPYAPLPFRSTWSYRQTDDGIWYHVASSSEKQATSYFRKLSSFSTGPVSSFHTVSNFSVTLRSAILRVPTFEDGSLTLAIREPGPTLNIRATQTEAELLDLIAEELATMVAQACQWLKCPKDTRYTLSFDDLGTALVQGNLWTLPALDLIGLPDNEQAHAAWQRGVRLWIIEALVRTVMDNPRAAERVIAQQLIKRMQAELGLVEPAPPDLELLSAALAEHDGLTLWQLWGSLPVEDTAYSRLYETEVTLLLDLIEEQVGVGRLFELLAALGRNESFDTALWSRFGIDPGAFKTAWAARLSELTGVVVKPEPALPTYASTTILSDLLESPPLPPPPTSPGDEVALVCDNQIWVGNLDGTQLVPLTAVGQRFYGLNWSPDGQWLLAGWQSDSKGPPSGLYLLAPDGTRGYLLINDPSMEAVSLGWRPDASEIIVYWRPLDPAAAGEVKIMAVDIASRERRELPGIPLWSPDGKHLAYVTHVSGVPVGGVWLADDDWSNARQIAATGWLSPGSWTPASDKLAFVLIDGGMRGDGPMESKVVVYDRPNERIQLSIDPAELTEEILSTRDEYVNDGSDLTTLMDAPAYSFWPVGWSADGRHLVIAGRGIDGDGNDTYPQVLVVVPMDGSPAQLVASRVGGYWEDVFWSPTDAERLIFVWRPRTSQPWNRDAYLFHLTEGIISFVRNGGHVAWSPDGTWAAFTAQEHIVIADRDGREHYPLPSNLKCYEFAWNPAAGLGD